ncbi:hypothetical protein P3T76_013905 [Phytophthora citrophthora]|uniref:Uncharacterized protein n=1 Tax=Phytophthora citrophthora TaxID=4793 RepID=A0AAD9G2Z8_9STRA|nr:hypothetical protein P3T76_013905 [Phytophthora citrophthora]
MESDSNALGFVDQYDGEDGRARLIRDYLAETPVYSARIFRRKSRMCRPLYLRKLGLSALQKCTAAIRQLAYGMPADAMDEYIRIAENTTTKRLLRFCVRIKGM